VTDCTVADTEADNRGKGDELLEDAGPLKTQQHDIHILHLLMLLSVYTPNPDCNVTCFPLFTDFAVIRDLTNYFPN
jgi:hypothetical protein